MNRRPRLGRTLVLAAALGAALYVALAAWAGWLKVGDRLGHFAWWRVLVALGLASCNYLIRFVKWDFFLARLGIRVRRGRSLGIFLSGFTLTVTPGKLGEVVKSYLLRESEGVAMARSAPIIVAERVTDLLALLILSVLGLGLLGGSWRVLVAGAVLVGGLVLAIAWEPLGRGGLRLLGRLPLVRRVAHRLEDFYEATRELHRPAPLVWATALSLVAWGAECLAFWLIIGGFPGGMVPIRLATFIYAVTTVAGALSFLPGGLGVQEGGMVALLVGVGARLDEATAFAATFITRLSTLWFAVGVGLIALFVLQRRGLRVDLAAASEGETTIDPAAGAG